MITGDPKILTSNQKSPVIKSAGSCENGLKQCQNNKNVLFFQNGHDSKTFLLKTYGKNLHFGRINIFVWESELPHQ